ncbi:MAG: aminotransferase class I/II-fold pyridoxal phosphate-dependent enzyme [Clostridiales bacterium]|nr:aminotransferase class I/II-fold pyridoxal phosphate-dependent enzyme [Clostridiales bacterium]
MDKRQLQTPILDGLKKFDKTAKGYFCVPSHHRGNGADSGLMELFGENVFKYDLTETPLTDDLHDAEGFIKEAECLAAELFGAYRTFFLVNGTTCANEAMIAASVSEGEKILVARNCHKSVLMGLIISGAEPIYIEPEKSLSMATFGSISPDSVKAAFEKNPGIKAFILTNPTYYGICSDLEKIAEICHSYGALLLMDEAHGAHLAFSKSLPKTALESGADMTAQSIHKTLGSMTQSSMLHVNGTLTDMDRVNAALNLVQSTSPSYILMASLDAARRQAVLKGGEMTENLLKISDYIRSGLNAIDGVHCYDGKNDKNIFDFDRTRIVFSIDGMTGFEIADKLLEKYKICTEMADSANVIAVLGHGDTKGDCDRLIQAVKAIASDIPGGASVGFEFPDIPPAALTPRKAFFAKSERVPLSESVGKISAEMIAPYPPGIPMVYPGEIITEDIYEFIAEAVENNRHIHGFSDKTMKTIKIIR